MLLGSRQLRTYLTVILPISYCLVGADPSNIQQNEKHIYAHIMYT